MISATASAASYLGRCSHCFAGGRAQRYIAGPELIDALHVAQRLQAANIPSTLGFWDGPGHNPADVQAQYLACLQAISQGGLDSYKSIKFPALQCNPDWLDPVVAMAIDHNVRLHFDSLADDVADTTWQAAVAAQRAGATVSCSVPGRWRRSRGDCLWAMEAGILVRVVKGQWYDSADPTLDPRAGFLGIVDELAGRVPRVAIATHDVALARLAIERLRAAGTACDWELLYGLPGRRAFLGPPADFGGNRAALYTLWRCVPALLLVASTPQPTALGAIGLGCLPKSTGRRPAVRLSPNRRSLGSVAEKLAMHPARVRDAQVRMAATPSLHLFPSSGNFPSWMSYRKTEAIWHVASIAETLTRCPRVAPIWPSGRGREASTARSSRPIHCRPRPGSFWACCGGQCGRHDSSLHRVLGPCRPRARSCRRDLPQQSGACLPIARPPRRKPRPAIAGRRTFSRPMSRRFSTWLLRLQR